MVCITPPLPIRIIDSGPSRVFPGRSVSNANSKVRARVRTSFSGSQKAERTPNRVIKNIIPNRVYSSTTRLNRFDEGCITVRQIDTIERCSLNKVPTYGAVQRRHRKSLDQYRCCSCASSILSTCKWCRDRRRSRVRLCSSCVRVRRS